MSAPTRRGLMGGVAVLAAVSTAPVAAAPIHPDAELLRLGAEMTATIAREDAAWRDVDTLGASDDDDDPLRVRASGLTEDVGDIVERISELPATTLDGLLVKTRAAFWCRSGELLEAGSLESGLGNGPPSTHAVVLAGLLNDLVAMGRAAA